jgi:secreted trypsin-like serine protease
VATPWLKTTADPSASCQGDSGGPQFFEDVQVSITIAGDPVCHTVNQDQRLDLPDVLDWLANPAPLAQ